MKVIFESIVGLSSIIILISGLSGSAQACDNFDQLMAQSTSLQSSFGDMSHPNCNRKPDESMITAVITCLESSVASYEPRAKSQADLQLSGLYGAITQCYRSGSAQQGPGKKSFQALEASTVADPTFELAWVSFGDTVADMKHDSFFKKKGIEIGLGISIDQEDKKAIQGLSALPQDEAVTAELAKLNR